MTTEIDGVNQIALADKVINHTIALIKELHAPREQKSDLAERVKSAIES